VKKSVTDHDTNSHIHASINTYSHIYACMYVSSLTHTHTIYSMFRW